MHFYTDNSFLATTDHGRAEFLLKMDFKVLSHLSSFLLPIQTKKVKQIQKSNTSINWNGGKVLFCGETIHLDTYCESLKQLRVQFKTEGISTNRYCLLLNNM